MSRQEVLGSFRSLIRASRLAFRGDEHALASARLRIRSEYVSAPATTEENLQMARDVAHLLRSNVVQGTRTDQSKDKPVFRLGLHKESELGDNDSRIRFDGREVEPEKEFDAGTLTGAKARCTPPKTK